MTSNAVLTDVPPVVYAPSTTVEASWQAPLDRRLDAVVRVDPAHPFFFDHPLDHLPGSLLVCGLFDLLAAAGHEVDADDRRLRMSCTFTGFCDTGAAPVATATGADEQWSVSLRDGERGLCHGRIDLFDGVPRPRPDRRPDGTDPASAPAELVHRHRPENILIGAPRTSSDGVVVPVLAPPAGHYLDRVAPGVNGVRTLVEAGRQFTTLLGPHVTGKPADSRLVWLDVAADLPTGIPLGAPLELCWRREPATSSRLRFVFDLVRADLPGEPLGTIVSSCLVLDEDTYRVLRNSGGPR